MARTIQQVIEAQFGLLTMQLAMLQTQLEQANDKIKELEKDKG